MINDDTIKLIKKNLPKSKPFYFQNGITTKIFSWKELEFLLNFRPFLTDKRIHLINGEKPYSWAHQAWLTDQTTFPPSLLGNEIQKRGFYFQDASRANKKINSICKQIENEFEMDCDAHIFFNLSNSLEGGFGIHFDSSHNIIVQIEGKSELKVWEGIADGNSEKPTNKPTIHKILNPGDAVFVPMKVWHSIESKTKRLSISFPFRFDSQLKCQDRTWIKLTK